jgi:hypothetical protein
VRAAGVSAAGDEGEFFSAMKGPSQQAHGPRLTMLLLLGAILPERRGNSSMGPVQEK